MIPFLVLAHALIGVLAVLSARVEESARGRLAQGLAVAGGIAGLVLFFGASRFFDSWRTLDVTSSGARIAGASAAAAWIVVAVTERSRGGGRWDVVACTGVASTALCMYALNGWVIPALIFAGIAASAIGLVRRRIDVVIGLVALGSALLGGALIWETMQSARWELPSPLSGGRIWLAAAAAIAFAVAAVTSESSDRPDPSTPLTLGLAFVTVASTARGTGPVVALVALGAALFAVVRTLTRESVSQRLVMVWVVAVTLSLATLTANLYVTTRAAIAGILAASVLRLWPLSLGRAQIERGILVAFVAVTAGFNAIAAAAAYSFARSTAIERVLDAAPWAAVSALLPLTLAGGVVLGASVGRNSEAEDYTRSGVLGSWALVALSVAVGVSPYVGAGQDAGLAGPGLYVVALAAGLGAARYSRALGAPPGPSAAAALEPRSRFLDTPVTLPWPAPAGVATLVLAVLTAVVILAATFQGLRVGFL